MGSLIGPLYNHPRRFSFMETQTQLQNQEKNRNKRSINKSPPLKMEMGGTSRYQVKDGLKLPETGPQLTKNAAEEQSKDAAEDKCAGVMITS